jgi:hypothetical protein
VVWVVWTFKDCSLFDKLSVPSNLFSVLVQCEFINSCCVVGEDLMHSDCSHMLA